MPGLLMGVPLTHTCLCLLTRIASDGARQVLLGQKKRGLGRGKIVALGGHVEVGESPADAAAREVKEESGIQVAADSLREAAQVTFLFPECPRWDMIAFVFTSAEWTGEPAETPEIRPEWFDVADLPLDRMWDDAKRWLPQVLAGERLGALFTYAEDCETVATAALSPLAATA
jgi:8-oxo-dGTP diphosphatase